jgi:excisionase family DNA binding protein
MALLSRSTTRM